MVARKRTKDGVETTKQNVIDEWDLKRDNACEYGTFIHKFLEEYGTVDGAVLRETAIGSVVGGRVIQESFLNNLEASLVDFLAEKKGVFKQEEIISCPLYAIAGTADVVVYRNNCIDIYDYKTNEDLLTISSDYKLDGLSHLLDTKYNTYALQLSVYARMLELSGKRVGNLCILWVSPTGELVEYPIPYLQKEAQYILDQVG